jgi:hypothetical protein
VNRHDERRKRFCLGDEALDVCAARDIADHDGDLCSGFFQLIGGSFKLHGIAAGDRHRVTAARESPGYGCAKAARCTDADDEYAGPRGFSLLLAHQFSPFIRTLLRIMTPIFDAAQAVAGGEDRDRQ